MAVRGEGRAQASAPTSSDMHMAIAWPLTKVDEAVASWG